MVDVNCAPASVVWTGHGATIEADVTVACNAASLVWTGHQATVEFSYTVECALASVTWTPHFATVLLGETVVDCAAAAITWSGLGATIEAETTVECDAAAITWTGHQAAITTTKVVDCTLAAITWSGLQAAINNDTTIECSSPSVTWTAHPATVQTSVTVNCNFESIVWTGHQATITRYRELTGIKQIPSKVPLRTIPDVSQIKDQKTREVLAAIKHNADILNPDSRAGNYLDRQVTYRDLWESGLARLNVGGALTGFVGYVNTPVAPPLPPIGGGEGDEIDLSIPPAPTGLEAAGALANVILVWDQSGFSQVKYYEIWRASADNLGSAVRVGTTAATVYADELGQGGLTRYYWIRVVSEALKVSPFNASAGTSATTGQAGEGDIEDGAITRLKIGLLAVDDARVANLSAAKVSFGVMSGDRINVNTLHGNRIKVNTLNGNVVIARSLAASAIAAYSITSNEIAAGSITAASGIIANAAVGTLQIAGNAVTIPVGAYIASGLLINQTTYQSIGSVTADFGGALVAVFCSFKWLSDDIFYWRLRRDGQVVVEEQIDSSAGLDTAYATFQFVDAPGAGVHTYSMDVFVTLAGYTVTVYYRSVVAIGLRR